MPYYISNENPECDGWAVEKDDGEVMGCHRTREAAIEQMVAISVAEDIEPGGERDKKRVTLVAGPPAAGKSTYVAGKAQPGDLIVDWERLVHAVSIGAGRAQSAELRQMVGDLRRAAFDAVAAAGPGVRAWVIAGVPGAKERAELAAQVGATETVILLCEREESYSRVAADPDRAAAAAGQHEAIDRWWDRYEPLDTDQVIRTDKAETKALPRLVAPDGAREEARRGLAWRKEFGRGGTVIGVARARDISNGRELSIETVKRMVSYFARHEVDKQGQGWSPGEDGYPSAGRIAWALWGGDPGKSWSERIVRQYEAEQDKTPAVDRPRKAGTRSQEVTMNVKRLSSSAHYQVKAAAPNAPGGEVEALVSVFNNTDLVGDRVMPGAFAKSLDLYAKSGKAIPFVWSHAWENPDAYIGKVTAARETKDGLVVTAQLFNTTTAQHIKTLLAEGVVSEFSFAYDVIQSAPGKDGVNELTELHILEAGPTLKGANPATQLIGVRAYERAIQKAAAGELSEGDFVTWGEDGYGQVVHIMTEGTLGAEGEPLSIEASADDPVALVREYDESEEGTGEETYEPTEIFTAHRFSELTAAREKAAPRAHVGAKAGRVLSAKNEGALREAARLIDEVLATLGTTEEKAAPAPLTASDALLLLEIEELS